jgi:hypothetical protein
LLPSNSRYFYSFLFPTTNLYWVESFPSQKPAPVSLKLEWPLLWMLPFNSICCANKLFTSICSYLTLPVTIELPSITVSDIGAYCILSTNWESVLPLESTIPAPWSPVFSQ